jgi:hypothetical protein
MAENPKRFAGHIETPPAGGFWLTRFIWGILAFVGLLTLVRCLRGQPAAPGASEPSPATHPSPATTAKRVGPEKILHPDGRIEHPTVRYETRDIPFGWILALLLLACGIAAVHYYVIAKFFWAREGSLATERKSPYPLMPQPSSQRPPEPRLEQIDRLDHVPAADAFGLEEPRQKALRRYGTTDERGVVRIPIEKAIKVTADKLSVRKTPWPHTEKASGLLDGGEPNSGRVYREEGQ